MSKSTHLKIVLTALIAVASMTAQAQTFSLNADGTPVIRSFAAGTYSIQFVDGGPLSTAYSLRDLDSNPSTFTPEQSFRTLSSFTIGSTTTEFGFALVPRGAGFMYAEYPTIASALANANNTPAGFTLTAPTNVTFRVVDNPYRDNSFGVTLNVSAVPEPSTYAMMFAGLTVTGWMARRRKRNA